MSTKKTLYHYTTAEGLIGIVSSRTLWATHLYFLNDSMEFRSGLETAMAWLEKAAERTKDPEQARRWLWLRKEVSIRGPSSIKAAYASSLSRERDSLSQWRAYCPAGGYAIGFPQDLLSKVAETHRFSLAECIYAPSEQEALIGDLIQRVAAAWVQNGQPEPWNRQDGGRFEASAALNWELYRQAPTLKNSAFASECEWRLLSTPEYRLSEERFRAGNRLVVPYVSMPLGDDRELWRQIDVVAGPSPHPELARAGAERLLRSHTGFALSVFSSEVPYRYW